MIIATGSATTRLRRYLLASAAIMGIATGGIAQAQIAETSAVSAAPGAGEGRVDAGGVLLEAHNAGPRVDVVVPDPYLQIADPGTPTTARDPVNITGVGQIVVDTGNGNGSIGLCTASLINPRTVLFAAHCVNSAPATSYGRLGPGSTGTAVSVGFSNNNLSALQQWLFAGANRYRSNPNTFLYNLSQVVYHPRSTEPGNGFRYADIAIGTLDTPTRNIPTWALLFSALPAPATIGAAGTGYHVNITGYGNNGTGISGANGGIDFRRRIAENTLGGLTSLDTLQNFLFGTPTGPLPQNLYWIDFDDPRRGTPAASPFDFNSFRDNALPREGGTAPGDSGGPLILDRTFARQVVIGVLSGGFSRFFTNQPAQSFGTNSFYQPLYLYWDYIAANNPYRYVTAVAGDGNWTDPTRWVTSIDPNYQIIGPNGQLVTGVPNNPGGTTIDTSGAFGQICFQNPTLSDCLDVRTNIETVTGGPIGTDGSGLANNAASLTLSAPSSQPGTGVLGAGSDALLEAQATQPAAALPAATIANGLPGATNFVPNNIDPVRTTGALGRYFDVTLAATGTITLNSTVTIDRFTLNGAGARLNIDAAGSLTSLIDITQTIGTMQVNGSLTSQGDYFLMAGGLNGTGTITTPFFTNMVGVISPGASGNAGSFGTLNFRGNVILTSGSTYLIDLGASGMSDRIAVVSNGVAGDGIANIGGGLNFNFSATTLRAGNSYTILTAQNGVTSRFANPAAFSAILRPTLTYTANAVQLTVTPGLYGNVVGNSFVQRTYAQLLDQNRGNAAALDSIYGPLDLQNAATIQATLDGLAPRSEALLAGIATTVVDNNARFHRDRLAQFDASVSHGGTIAVIGRPIQLAAANATSLNGGQPVQSDSQEARVQKANLPDDVGVYLAGGYIDGSSAPARLTVPAGARDRFNGFYILGGIEKDLGDGIIGLSFGYTELNGNVTGFAQSARGSLYQGTLYARSELGGGWSMDGQVNAGVFDSTTIRNVGFVGTNYRLVANKAAFALGGEVGFQKSFALGFLNVAPRVSVRSNFIDFGRVTESGGGPALLYTRDNLSSVQGRAGFNFTATKGSAFKPFLSANYVHEFDQQRPNSVGANFVGGTGPNPRFLLASIDRNWFEVSGGVSYTAGNIELSLTADTTAGRDDVQNQSYRGAITLRF
ncbi:MAG: autotransporter domain-containing protein [Sphingobium sp.]|nr:autotransporter domain-containing protein [Sphingobium sp.]